MRRTSVGAERAGSARARWRAAAAVFLLAVAVRAAFSLTLGEKLFWSDEHQYLKGLSWIFDKGEWYLESSYKPPGYVYFLAPIRALFGPAVMPIRLVQAALGGATCLLTLALGAKLFSWRAGLLASAYLAVYPLHIYLCGVILPQAVETAVVVGVLLLLVMYAERRRRTILAAAGCLTGLCALAVPPVLALLPIAAVWSAAQTRGTWRAVASDWAILAGCALLMIAPWTVRNYIVERKLIFIATLGNQLLYFHNNPWADPDDKERTREIAYRIQREVEEEASNSPEGLTADEIYLRRFREYVSRQPGRFLRMYLKKFRNFFALVPSTFSSNEHTSRRNKIIAAISYGPVLFLSMLGALVCARERRRGLLLASVPVLFALGYSVFHTTVRYRVPTDPCSICLASFASLWAISALRRKEAEP